MNTIRVELRSFAYKAVIAAGALTFCAGLASAATTIGTNIQTDGTFAAVGTSTFSGSVGIGTTTPGSLFSVGGITNFTAATSTFYSSGGINLQAGCYAVNGTCVGGGGGSSGTDVHRCPRCQCLVVFCATLILTFIAG